MPRRGENIRKRKDGRWEGRYIAARREDGRAVYKSVYAESYSDVKYKLALAKGAAAREPQEQQKRAKDTAASRAHEAEICRVDYLADFGADPDAGRAARTKAPRVRDIPEVIHPFRDVCVEWLDSVSRNVRQSTYVKYHNICKKHIIPHLGAVSCEKLTTARLDAFTEALRRPAAAEEKPLSDSSVRTVCTILNSVIRYASAKGYMAGLPPVTVKSETWRPVKVLSRTEQRRLTRYILANPDNGRIGILICLYTGIRIGEVCALRWDDIDTVSGILTVNKTLQRLQNVKEEGGRERRRKKEEPLRTQHQESSHICMCDLPCSDECYIEEKKTHLQIDAPKSIHSNRTIPLPDFLCDIIDENLTRIPGAYFLSGDSRKPVEPRTYQYRYKKYLREAGLEESNFHVLRHTFATHCVSLGFDTKTLSEILGHSNVSITLNKYVHPTLEMKRQQMNRLNLPVSESGS